VRRFGAGIERSLGLGRVLACGDAGKAVADKRLSAIPAEGAIARASIAFARPMRAGYGHTGVRVME
jgi:hypothetical protein